MRPSPVWIYIYMIIVLRHQPSSPLLRRRPQSWLLCSHFIWPTTPLIHSVRPNYWAELPSNAPLCSVRYMRLFGWRTNCTGLTDSSCFALKHFAQFHKHPARWVYILYATYAGGGGAMQCRQAAHRHIWDEHNH